MEPPKEGRRERQGGWEVRGKVGERDWGGKGACEGREGWGHLGRVGERGKE